MNYQNKSRQHSMTFFRASSSSEVKSRNLGCQGQILPRSYEQRHVNAEYQPVIAVGLKVLACMIRLVVLVARYDPFRRQLSGRLDRNWGNKLE